LRHRAQAAPRGRLDGPPRLGSLSLPLTMLWPPFKAPGATDPIDAGNQATVSWIWPLELVGRATGQHSSICMAGTRSTPPMACQGHERRDASLLMALLGVALPSRSGQCSDVPTGQRLSAPTDAPVAASFRGMSADDALNAILIYGSNSPTQPTLQTHAIWPLPS
jgi:hypothetical protein